MSTIRPVRSRKATIVIIVLAGFTMVCCFAAKQELRQSNLNDQLFDAVEFGTTSELAHALEKGANPNFGPRSMEDMAFEGNFLSNLLREHFVTHANHRMPVLGYVLNGCYLPPPLTAQQIQQAKAKHEIPNPVRYADAYNKLRVLLEHHADPNFRYRDTNALIHAVRENQSDAVQMLLKYGADPDAPTADGSTARKVASLFPKMAVVLPQTK